jgi:hypothetical protein
MTPTPMGSSGGREWWSSCDVAGCWRR